MTNDQYTQLMGMLAAQSYLLETLLGSQCVAAGDPIATVGKLCNALAQQIRSDHSANLFLFPNAENTESVTASALEYVETMRARLLGQFENAAPISGGLH